MWVGIQTHFTQMFLDQLLLDFARKGNLKCFLRVVSRLVVQQHVLTFLHVKVRLTSQWRRPSSSAGLCL